jgi:uncharacterized protein (UPF0548 family)
VKRLLGACASEDLTYTSVGCSLSAETPPDLRRRRWSTALASPDALSRARSALEDWQVHRGAGLVVEADGPLTVGTNVAMGAPLPVGWIDVTCRIVAVVDEPDRFGFAYGTLPNHPEVGEESFTVARQPAGGPVEFVVESVSRPAHPLARLAPPITERLQASATARYLDAMQQVVSK